MSGGNVKAGVIVGFMFLMLLSGMGSIYCGFGAPDHVLLIVLVAGAVVILVPVVTTQQTNG